MRVPGDYDHVCAHEGCEESVNNHYHARAAAHEAGWFQQKDGTFWCPEHVPEWVADWRARKKSESEKEK